MPDGVVFLFLAIPRKNIDVFPKVEQVLRNPVVKETLVDFHSKYVISVSDKSPNNLISKNAYSEITCIYSGGATG